MRQPWKLDQGDTCTFPFWAPAIGIYRGALIKNPARVAGGGKEPAPGEGARGSEARQRRWAQGRAPPGLQRPSDTIRRSHLPPAPRGPSGRSPATSCSTDDVTPSLSPLQPAAPRGPGDPVPSLGTPSHPWGRCLVGQGRAGPRGQQVSVFAPCLRSHTPAPRCRILAGHGSGRGKGASPAAPAPVPVPRDGPGSRVTLPSGSGRRFHACSPRGRGREGSGRRGGEAKCEISHLPRGGRRLPGGCQPAPPAASLRRHQRQRHERHCLHGPSSCTGLCRPRHRPGGPCIPLAGGWWGQAQASRRTAPGQGQRGWRSGDEQGWCPGIMRDSAPHRAGHPRAGLLSIPCHTPWGLCLILHFSLGGSSPIWHVSTEGEKAVFNLQVYFYRQQTAAPGTFPCLELIFAEA